VKKRDELLADVHQRIAANARYYRLRRGISQREAAAGLGIADTTIRNIEHGKKPVSTLLLARLAAFYALENVDALLAARELITLRRGAFSVKYSLPIGERT
jgi:transcriptional regulator with XRE-family HTH domain